MYRVSDVMKKREDIAILKKSSCLKETILKMTQFPQGIACVEDKNKLVGVITDGDKKEHLINLILLMKFVLKTL